LLDKIARYWHTLRHLKAVQFYGRIWFKLYRPRIAKLKRDASMRLPLGSWQISTGREVSMLCGSAFRFLNRTHSLPERGGWNDAALEKLWLYNLHYFDDLNAQNAHARAGWHLKMIERWISENPPAVGNGWEPYPTSLRIVNWLKWLATGNVAPPGMIRSLVLQAGWLVERLERHLLGNHLFANAKALVFAGLFFEGPQPANWLATGLKIISKELTEQVLADGGNFERSTMYHAIFLEDVLDLINATQFWTGRVQDEQVAYWRETAGRMLSWLMGMTHPDGEIALFNDAAFGVAPRVAELKAYAERVGVVLPNDVVEAKVIQFADSGYVRIQTHDAVAFLDVAPVGPDYLPGHAHADTLSFELSVFDQRVVINGGTSCYGMGPDRLSERGTSAHSTVEVAGANSSDVWSGFRVARRAYPFNLEVDSESCHVACSHNGYKHLPGAPVHRRAWQMNKDCFQVRDSVHGGKYEALARFILHPAIQLAAVNTNIWHLKLAGGQRLRLVVQAGKGRIEPARYSPEFGKQLQTQSLVIELAAGVADVTFFWVI
jgi:uncharacterized heparinase superfamily protein